MTADTEQQTQNSRHRTADSANTASKADTQQPGGSTNSGSTDRADSPPKAAAPAEIGSFGAAFMSYGFGSARFFGSIY